MTLHSPHLCCTPSQWVAEGVWASSPRVCRLYQRGRAHLESTDCSQEASEVTGATEGPRQGDRRQDGVGGSSGRRALAWVLKDIIT